MSTLLIRNIDAVVTCDKEDSMPRGVDLLCVDGIIQRIGKDLESQLKGRDLGDSLLLPVNMLRSGEDVFLDDMTVGQLEEALQTNIIIVESDGQSLVRAVTGFTDE
jgi:hypothetical protein